MTARWVVDEVREPRQLHIVWRPISLLFKNEPEVGSEYYEAVVRSHRMLRVMEAARAAAGDPDAGNHDVFKLYWEFGSRIHHDRDLDFDIADAVRAVGLDPKLADAADDEAWDVPIRAQMDEGLALVGDDVGTPIIAMVNSHGVKQGYFGPVITEVPDSATSLSMWDALVALMDVDIFFELKRSRTASLDFGDRPKPVD